MKRNLILASLTICLLSCNKGGRQIADDDKTSVLHRIDLK